MAERHAASGRGSGHAAAGDRAESRRLSLIRFAVWLGLIAWVAEYTVLSVRKFVFNERTTWYVESAWLAALVYVVAFTLLGVGVAVIARRGARARRFAFRALVALAVLSVLLVFRSIDRIASLLLSIGVGYQVGSIFDRHEAGARWLVQRTLPALGGATALIVIALAAYQPIREWRAYSSLPDADPDAPNVIMIILDTVRARELGLYGYDRGTTPELDAFAARGVTFDRAISTASWTLPSHYGMLTGLYSHELPADLGLTANPGVDRKTPFLSDVLREHGYGTAGFVANMSYTVDETGLDRGFIHWEDHTISPGQIGISTAPGRTILANGRLRRLLDWHDFPIRKPAANVNRSMLKWIDAHDDRPFFVLANYFDAHNPYLPPREFESRFAERRPAAGMRYHPHTVQWWDNYGHPAAELEAQRDMYDGAVAWLDSEMGRLFDGLESRGLLENTLLIITSDHGEAFGEHDRLGHGTHVYNELIHVPLVIVFGPETPAGARVAGAVTLADLPATVLDLVGIDDHALPGQSLAPTWDGSEAWLPRSPIIAHENTGRAKGSLLLDGWHYIRSPDGTEELFGVESDPHEQRDLAADPGYARRLAYLRSAFDSVIAVTPAQRTQNAAADLARGSTGAANRISHR